MLEISAVTAGIASVKQAIELAKAIKDAGVTLEAAELKLRMAELISALADAKMGFAEAQQQLIEKDLELQQTKGKLATKTAMQFERPYYFSESRNGKRTGPFCAPCWDSKQLQIHLTKQQATGLWLCNICKGTFKDGGFRGYHPSTYSAD